MSIHKKPHFDPDADTVELPRLERGRTDTGERSQSVSYLSTFIKASVFAAMVSVAVRYCNQEQVGGATHPEKCRTNPDICLQVLPDPGHKQIPYGTILYPRDQSGLTAGQDLETAGSNDGVRLEVPYPASNPVEPAGEHSGFVRIRNYIAGSNISQSVAYKFFADESFQNILRRLVLGGLNPNEQDRLYDLLEKARVIPENTRGRIAAMQDPIARAMDYIHLRKLATEQNEHARAQRMKRRALTMCLRAIQMQKSAYEIAEMSRLTANMDVDLVTAADDYMPLMKFLQIEFKVFGLEIDPEQFLQTRVPNRTNFFQEVADAYDKYKDILPITDIISKEVFVAIFVHELAPRLKNVEGNSYLFASLIMTYISDLQPFNAFRPRGGALRIGGTQISDAALNWLEFDENIRKELVKLGKNNGVAVDGFQSAFLLANISFDALFLLGYGALATNHRYSGGRVANIIASNRVGGPASRKLGQMATEYAEWVLEFEAALKSRWRNVLGSNTE